MTAAAPEPAPDADDRVAELELVQQLLMDAEQRAASVPELQLRVSELEQDLAHVRRELDGSRERTQELDERLMRSEQVLVDVMSSPSWQITRPLRRAKHLLS